MTGPGASSLASEDRATHERGQSALSPPAVGIPLRVAALFVQTDGCYFGIEGVEPWDISRDARTYGGPHPVVAHPPCERWGRMWFGSPLKPDPERFRLGDDGGCFKAALTAVRAFGGVLEHPEASRAWRHFGLNEPPRSGGWVVADFEGGWTCCVEQGHYGHAGRKMTWLYAHSVELPSLTWGSSGQRLCPVMLERHGYLKARRCGITGSLGTKRKKDLRGASPEPFRDLLLSIARSAIADTHPKGGDAPKIAAPFMSGGGADRQSPITSLSTPRTD